MQMCTADDPAECRRAAREYAALPVDWSFTDAVALKSFPDDVLKRCGEIRALAAMGEL